MNTDSDVIVLELADEPSRRQAGSSRRHHWTMLVLCGVVVVAAFLLEVRAEHRVAIAAVPRCLLPETCMSRQLFGSNCPGCGLTRSFIHLAHGNWQASMAVHRLGWMMAAATLLQFPYRISCLRHGRISPLGTRLPKWFGYTLIGSLVANWFFEMVCHPPAY